MGYGIANSFLHEVVSVDNAVRFIDSGKVISFATPTGVAISLSSKIPSNPTRNKEKVSSPHAYPFRLLLRPLDKIDQNLKSYVVTPN